MYLTSPSKTILVGKIPLKKKGLRQHRQKNYIGPLSNCPLALTIDANMERKDLLSRCIKRV